MRTRAPVEATTRRGANAKLNCKKAEHVKLRLDQGNQWKELKSEP